MNFLQLKQQIFFHFHGSTTSSFSKETSNSSNSSSRLPFMSMNPIEVTVDLQLFLGSLGQFLFANINFSILSFCNGHLHKLVSIPTSEKYIYNSI